MSSDVAIIGGGLAGCYLASLLVEQGKTVSVFEKGRGVGGRAASRRIPLTDHPTDQTPLVVDHGAPALHGNTSHFQDLMRDLSGRNAVIAWPSENHHSWIGTPGMNSSVKCLLPAEFREPLGSGRLHLKSTIYRIMSQQDSPSGRNEVYWRDGVGAFRSAEFDVIISTAPAPQSIAMLMGGDAPGMEILEGVDLPNSCALPSWARPLSNVRYDPCWTMIAGFANAPQPKSSSNSIINTDLGTLIHQSAKTVARGFASDATDWWIFHADAAWSDLHLDDDPEKVKVQLLEQLITAVGGVAQSAEFIQTHRWRFARVSEVIWEDALSSPDGSLHICGDAFSGPDGMWRDADASISSAHALAQRL